MREEDIYKNLLLISYELFHLEHSDIFHQGNKPQEKEYDYANANWKKVKEFYESLEWAIENPDFDFKSILFSHILHSNKEIYYYFSIWYDYYKKLLEDRNLI